MQRALRFALTAFVAIYVSLSHATTDEPARMTSPRGKPWEMHVIDGSSRGADGVRLADVNGDGLMDITTGWEEGGVTRVYLHPGHKQVTGEWPTVTVGRTKSVEDAVFVDMNWDGSVDVVTSCEGGTKTMFAHLAPEDSSRYLESAAWTQTAIKESVDRMRWMFCLPMELDDRYGTDLVAGGKGGDAQIGRFRASEAGSLAYRWHPICDAGWIMSLIPADMDGDGDMDVVTSDRRGSLRGCRWLENPGAGEQQTQPWRNHFIGGRDAEVMFMKLADLDGDGRQDALAAARPRTVFCFRRLDDSGRSWSTHRVVIPQEAGTAKAVAVGDMDHDGSQDLVITCEHANGAKFGVMWASCSGDPWHAEWTTHRVSSDRGIKFDRIELLDLDGDGDLDILTCEEREGGGGLGVIWYENPGA